MNQQSLPFGDDVQSHVETDESRKDFERTRWKGDPPPAKCRQGRMFDHMDDLPDQTYLFGE